MFQKLVSHNQDIRRLVDKGYAVGFDNKCIVIRDVPYLDKLKQLQWGAIVSKLVFVDQEKVQQDNHQVFFAGSSPHGLDGKIIPNLGDSQTQLILTDFSNDVVVQRSFSNKPKSGSFPDFFEKIESYVSIISGPAIEMYNSNPYTFRVKTEMDTESVFKFQDTLTSRAEITDLSANFKDDIIAVIGVGGTGAYVLDFLVKTPVKEIRAFDLDQFQVHNAFRSPGKLEETELGKPKIEVYHSRYQNFRSGLNFTAKSIDANCDVELAGVTFAFVCVDKGASRKDILELLLSKKIPFIDVGMGLKRTSDNSLNGTLRTTYFSAEAGQRTQEKNLVPVTDNPDDEYRANIQISELNALNACLAVIKFKQLRKFYLEQSNNYHLLFELRDFKIVGISDED